MSADLLSAAEAVSVVVNMDPPSPVGSLHVSTEDGTKGAKIYFKDGLIYAVSVEGHEFPFALRARSGGTIDLDDLDDAVSSVGGEVSNPRLVQEMLGKQLLDQATVDSYLKENFLANATEVLSWEQVRSQWQEGDFTEDFIVRFIDGATLVDLCQKRRKTLVGACERVGSSVESFVQASFVMARNVGDDEKLATEAIYLLHKADGSTSIDQAASDLGLTRLLCAKYLYKMWESGIIEFVNLPVASPDPEPEVETLAAPVALSTPQERHEDEQIEEAHVIDPEEVLVEVAPSAPTVVSEPAQDVSTEVDTTPEILAVSESVAVQEDSSAVSPEEEDPAELAARISQIMHSLRSKVDTLRTDVNELDQGLEEGKKQITEDSARLEDAQRAVAQLSARIQRRQAQLDSQERSLTEKRRHLNDAQGRYEQLRSILHIQA